MTLFETVKGQITTRQAAERYGLRVGHGGMCRCPFHDDHNPSLKVDKRFHCFGCQADGDVISFTSRLFNVTPSDAALKLAGDFGIQYDPQQSVLHSRKTHVVSQEAIFAHRAAYCYWELCEYRNLLIQWQQQYAPLSHDEDLHPRFLEALHNLEIVEYQLDVLLSGTDIEKQQIVNDFFHALKTHKEVSLVEPIEKTAVYRHSSTYAREHNELDQFRQSHWANLDCKRSIEKSISDHFDGMRLDRRAISEVMDRFSIERIALVLAATVQEKSWDGRFSSANKDWAFSFDFPGTLDELGADRRREYAVTTHPAVLDGFIGHFRKEVKAMEHPAEKDAAMPHGVKPTDRTDKPIKKKAHSYER